MTAPEALQQSARSAGPEVSVVLPTWRVGGFESRVLISRCEAMLRSPIQVEVVVVDDVPDSGQAPDLFTTWAWKSQGNGLPVRLLSGAATGVADARNLAVGHAQGRFVWFVDDDDRWSDTGLSHLIQAALRYDADVVVGDAWLTDLTHGLSGRGARRRRIPDGQGPRERTGEQAARDLLVGRVSGHLWNKLIRRQLLLDHPFPQLIHHSDLGGLVRLLPSARRVVSVPTPVYEYVVRPGSLLQGASMRWRDLPDCLGLAREQSSGRPGVVFAVHCVAVPLFQSVERRRATMPPEDVEAAHRWIRATLTPYAIGVAIVSGRPLTGVRAAIIRMAPALYGFAYRGYRWIRTGR